MIGCLALRLESRKRRQQRRVDVEDAVPERVEQRGADYAHESGETDEGDVVRPEDRDDGVVVRVPVGVVARVEPDRFDARVPGAREAGASTRFEMRTARRASSVPAAMAAMIAWRLFPRPEISTAIRGRERFADSAISMIGKALAIVLSDMPRRQRVDPPETVFITF
jgi:uncharacterized protein DUF3418